MFAEDLRERGILVERTLHVADAHLRLSTS